MKKGRLHVKIIGASGAMLTTGFCTMDSCTEEDMDSGMKFLSENQNKLEYLNLFNPENADEVIAIPSGILSNSVLHVQKIYED